MEEDAAVYEDDVLYGEEQAGEEEDVPAEHRLDPAAALVTGTAS